MPEGDPGTPAGETAAIIAAIGGFEAARDYDLWRRSAAPGDGVAERYEAARGALWPLLPDPHEEGAGDAPGVLYGGRVYFRGSGRTILVVEVMRMLGDPASRPPHSLRSSRRSAIAEGARPTTAEHVPGGRGREIRNNPAADYCLTRSHRV